MSMPSPAIFLPCPLSDANHEPPAVLFNIFSIRMCKRILAPALSFMYETDAFILQFYFRLIVIAVIARDWLYIDGGQVSFTQGNYVGRTFQSKSSRHHGSYNNQ